MNIIRFSLFSYSIYQESINICTDIFLNLGMRGTLPTDLSYSGILAFPCEACVFAVFELALI